MHLMRLWIGQHELCLVVVSMGTPSPSGHRMYAVVHNVAYYCMKRSCVLRGRVGTYACPNARTGPLKERTGEPASRMPMLYRMLWCSGPDPGASATREQAQACIWMLLLWYGHQYCRLDRSTVLNNSSWLRT